MRTPTSQDDESMHPLWLGMLMLFCIVLLIGTLCCLRIKCSSQLRHLYHRLFVRKSDTSIKQDNTPPRNHAYNWTTVYSPPKDQSPRLYTLVNHIRRQQFAIRQQRIKGDEEEQGDDGQGKNSSLEFDHIPQISISSTLDTNRNSEIARKFYASLRDTSQYPNSSSLESCPNDPSVTSDASSLSLKQPRRKSQKKFFRTPEFFKSIVDQDDLTM